MQTRSSETRTLAVAAGLQETLTLNPPVHIFALLADLIGLSILSRRPANDVVFGCRFESDSATEVLVLWPNRTT